MTSADDSAVEVPPITEVSAVEVPPTGRIATYEMPTEQRREIWRGRLALTLMILLALLAIGLVAVAVWLVRPFNMQAVSLLIAGIFGPILALVGTVVGFYFGQVSASARDAGSGSASEEVTQ
jgi:hypothetical protein